MPQFDAVNILSPQSLLQAGGAPAVPLFMFVETGLLIGFFLPSDSLLLLAGIAASPVDTDIVGVQLSLPPLLVRTPVCAFLGAQVGHLLGARYGRRLRTRRSGVLRPEYVERAEVHFERYGPVRRGDHRALADPSAPGDPASTPRTQQAAEKIRAGMR